MCGITKLAVTKKGGKRTENLQTHPVSELSLVDWGGCRESEHDGRHHSQLVVQVTRLCHVTTLERNLKKSIRQTKTEQQQKQQHKSEKEE
jgi:hypothetical protein